MMTFTITPSFQLGPSERADNSKLNRLGSPTVEVSGQASSDQIADRSITALKTVPDAHFYAVASGFATNTYAVNFTPDIVGLVDGLELVFAADAACSAAPLLNVDGLGAKTLYKFYNQALEPGDIVTGQMVKVRYSSAAGGWQVLSPLATARRIGLVNSFEGIRLEYLGATSFKLMAQPGGASAVLADASFNVLPWTAANTGGSASDVYTCTLTTVGLNGRDSAGAVTGWSYVFIVSDGTTAGLMTSASPVKPSAAGGFTPLYWCRVSAVWNTGGTTLRKFSQNGRWIAVEPYLLTTTELADGITAYDASTDSYSEFGANAGVFAQFAPTAIMTAWRGTMGVDKDYGSDSISVWLALAAHPDGHGEQMLIAESAGTGTAFCTHFKGAAESFELPFRSGGFYYKTLNAVSNVTYHVVGTAFAI